MGDERIHVKISGTGVYLPETIITNKELESKMDTSDKWIQEKTGIKERRISKKEELPSDLAKYASLDACKNAGISPEELDLIIVVATFTDFSVPATAAIVQKKIGSKKAAVFDIKNACQGFVTGLIIARNFIKSGEYNKVLVVSTYTGATVMNISNWEDRTKGVFFGDGAGAAILEKSDKEGIMAIDIGNDPEYSNILQIPLGGIQMYKLPDEFPYKLLGKPMEGKEVFKFATKKAPESIINTLQKINLKVKDLDFVILHQANINIIKSIMNSLGLPMKKTYTNIEKYGNTSESSVPIALHEALQNKKIKNGDLIAICAFGSGLGWATIVMKWQ